MNVFTLTAAELKTHNPDISPVLLPLGPTQQHGPHLPLGTSFMLAEGIAAGVSKILKGQNLTPLVAPSLPYAAAELTMGLPGCFSVNARVFAEFLYEVGQAFHREGYRWFAVISHHLSLDHLKAMAVAITDLNKLPGFVAFDPLTPWLLGRRPALEESLRRMGLDPSSEIFGDVVTTSAIMHLDPTLVKTDLLPKLKPFLASLSWETLKGHFTLKQMGAQDGYIGTPGTADGRLGEWYLDTTSAIIAETVVKAMQGNPPPSLPMVVRLLMRLVDLEDAG